MENHFIIFITYLTNEVRVQCVTTFILLLQIKDGITQSMYDAVITLLTEMDLFLMKLVRLVFDSSLFILHI